MGQSWYIDALDARAGRAFVSFRASPLDYVLRENGVHESYFISAPSFSPEPVSGVSLALAASRTSFQLGLFADESEIAFPSLASVTEFVRRCFLDGGGGTGPAGVGPPPAPEGRPPSGGDGAPPDGEGDGPAGSSGGGRGSASQAALLFENLKGFGDLRDSGAELIAWGTEWIRGAQPRATGQAPAATDRLTRAFTSVWLELLSRTPRAPSDADGWIRWLASADVLQALSDRFSLPAWHRNSADRKVALRRASVLLSDIEKNAGQGLNAERPWLHPVLLPFFDPTPGNPDDLNLYMLLRRRWAAGGPVCCGGQPGADLEALPLPVSLCRRLDFGNVAMEEASLKNFLMLCCAKPDDVFPSAADGKLLNERFNLLLLAACIIAMSPHRPAGPAIRWDGRPYHPDLAGIWHDKLLEETLNWLSLNLPRFRFSTDVEGLVGKTRSLSYSDS